MLIAFTSFQISLFCNPILTIIFLVAFTPNREVFSEKVFEFPEYDYVESPKYEIAWREWEAACEQTPVCLGIMDLEKLRCVRKCISPSCYNEIYSFDELEEGEIDIRFHSFKGCFASRMSRRRL